MSASPAFSRLLRCSLSVLCGLVLLAPSLFAQSDTPVDTGEAAEFEQLVETGVADDRFSLGMMHYTGQGAEQNYQEALSWLRQAAEQGHVEAQFNVGVMYYLGEGTDQDIAEAARWYRMAAEQGFVEAQFRLGVIYHEGNGVGQDFSEAYQWFKKAAEQDYAMAQINLGVMYLKGQAVEQDFLEARKWFTAAEDEEAHALVLLGLIYYNGLGVAQNDIKAIKYYIRAALKGAPEAVDWIHTQAEQGNVLAQATLVQMYFGGEGVDRDDRVSKKWMDLVSAQARSGQPVAQYCLGEIYNKGFGVKIKNNRKAVQWYQKAAEQGYAPALYSIGVMRYDGRGSPKDYSVAAEWIKKAAAQNYAAAQRFLGWIYARGQGVEKNEQAAMSWYRKAAAQEDKIAIRILEAIDSGDAIDAEGYLPRAIVRVPPVYPYGLRKDGVEGSVTLILSIDYEGKVVNATVKDSTHKEFESPALHIVRQWKFEPCISNGRASNSRCIQSIKFKLRENHEAEPPPNNDNPNRA